MLQQVTRFFLQGELLGKFSFTVDLWKSNFLVVDFWRSKFFHGGLLAKYCFFHGGFLDNFVTVETRRLVETRGDNLVTVETCGDSWRQFCDGGDSESLTLTVKLDKN